MVKVTETKLDGVDFEIYIPSHLNMDIAKLLINGEAFYFDDRNLAKLIKILCNSVSCSDFIEQLPRVCYKVGDGYEELYYSIVDTVNEVTGNE